MDIWLTILANGLVYGLLLFLMASGLTLILSLMGILNFAHGAFFMLGAYFGYEIGRHGGFWTALLLAPLLTGMAGALVERWGLRPFKKYGPRESHGAELLFTFALTFILQEITVLFWGRLPVEAAIPAWLQQQIPLTSGFSLSAYKILLVLLSMTALVSLWAFLSKSRFGLLIEAARSNPDMVAALGHDTGRINNIVFGVGTGLAGLAGAAGGPILVTEPGMAASLGAILFVVIITGGLGSLKGAFIACLLVGWLQHGAVAVDISLSDIIGDGLQHLDFSLARASALLPYLMLILVLVLRPEGLAGRKGG